jgi:hypothetical protein
MEREFPTECNCDFCTGMYEPPLEDFEPEEDEAA